MHLAVLSLIGWVFELAVFYVLLLGFPVPASVPVALLTGAAANFATLVPSSPGYVGTFDAVVVKVLMDVTNISAEHATAHALLVHSTLFLPVVVLGILILWRANLSFDQVTRSAARRLTMAGQRTSPDRANRVSRPSRVGSGRTEVYGSNRP
jgi:uncharacterized membrane protein YbhN (UPF0104 family)